jgi:hypothetical protein
MEYTEDSYYVGTDSKMQHTQKYLYLYLAKRSFV